jgi:uncharacterized protein
VEPDYLLGNIMETPIAELIGSERQLEFGKNKYETLPKCCRECRYLFTCNGECPKNRISQTPDGEYGLNYLCNGLKAFFEHTAKPMQIMAEFLKHGQRAGGVMQVLSAEENHLEQQYIKAGRNDQCPCGSGVKFKKCHGAARS